MIVKTVNKTAAGQSALIGTVAASVFNVGFGAVVSGTVTYTIEHTFNGVDFFDHEFLVGQTTSQDGNYAFPVAGIRINVTAGTGSVVLTTIQAKG